MIWLVGIIVLGGIISIFVTVAQKGQAIAAVRETFLASHEGWEVFVSPHDKQLIAIDQASRRIALGSPEAHQEFEWRQIGAVEIERNGTSLTSTNRGSQVMGAAVGGLLLGPAGLLLGGLTGSTRSVEKVRTLALKIIVDDQSQPVRRVVFLQSPGDGFSPDSELLKPIVEAMEKFHALIANAIRAEEKASVPVARIEASQGVEDRIAKLWSLKESGALTEAEFTTAKLELLGAGPAKMIPASGVPDSGA